MITIEERQLVCNFFCFLVVFCRICERFSLVVCFDNALILLFCWLVSAVNLVHDFLGLFFKGYAIIVSFATFVFSIWRRIAFRWTGYIRKSLKQFSILEMRSTVGIKVLWAHIFFRRFIILIILVNLQLLLARRLGCPSFLVMKLLVFLVFVIEGSGTHRVVHLIHRHQMWLLSVQMLLLLFVNCSICSELLSWFSTRHRPLTQKMMLVIGSFKQFEFIIFIVVCCGLLLL